MSMLQHAEWRRDVQASITLAMETSPEEPGPLHFSHAGDEGVQYAGCQRARISSALGELSQRPYLVGSAGLKWAASGSGDSFPTASVDRLMRVKATAGYNFGKTLALSCGG
jgi:hypothetical protein